MSSLIYSPPDYALGATPSAPDTAQAKQSLNKMKRSLKSWLKFRRKIDAFLQSEATAEQKKSMPQSRFYYEQDLANTLYQALVKAGFDASKLPPPDVQADPDAAVKLANIVLSDQVSSPQAQGFFWLIAIPVGGIVLVLTHLISTKADLAKEQARLECVKIGKCTDTGFWLKIASVGVIGWLAWDKFGLREAVERRKKK